MKFIWKIAFIFMLVFAKGLYAHDDYSGTKTILETDSADIFGIPTYTNINNKSWEQILSENTFDWQPPYTVHLPIQPVHSADWVHVDAALNGTRRHITPDVSFGPSYEEAQRQKTRIVQFAFEDPAVVPDFRLSTLSLTGNKYPVVTGDFYSRDMYYQIEYICTPVDEDQSLLSLHVSVTNESENKQRAHVRSKINFQRENDLFDYHYNPFDWDANKTS